jgi:hypothetical protein
MWNEPSKKRLNQLPSLYETEDTPLQQKEVWLHFFIGGSDWWAVEFDHKGGDLFFGFVILNNDHQNSEWGYFSLSEMRSIKVSGFLEIDCELEEYWQVRPASQVNDICLAQGWLMPNLVSKRLGNITA